MAKQNCINFRLDDQEVRQLDKLAMRARTSRSGVLRLLLAHAKIKTVTVTKRQRVATAQIGQQELEAELA
ncbi:MAG: ribbon-helix-helix protein, CopG family [Caldilineaceae bacterium]